MRPALAAFAALLAASAAAAAATPPTLRIVRASPLVVVGTHFRAGETVKVTAYGTPHVTRSVRARNGTFTIDLGKVVFGRCAGVRVTALGSQGSAAATKVPRPACTPAA